MAAGLRSAARGTTLNSTNPEAVDSADQYLSELQQEGTVHSTGRFTLSREKLREKLSQFNFERPSQWILKVVQALVLAEVKSCRVVQSHQRTEIHVQSSGSLYSTDGLEQAFFDPDRQQGASLSHLVSALWYLSFNLQLTWAWKDQGSQVGLLWNGSELTRVHSVASDYSTLQISHARLSAKSGWWAQLFSNPVQTGAESCAQISRELHLHAYTCPFPLKLDGFAIDNLLRCSTKARRPNSATQATELVAPPGGGQAGSMLAPLLISQRWREGEEQEDDAAPGMPNDSTWLALLFGHLRPVVHTYGNDYAISPAPSRVTWVRHGVLVGEEQLSTERGASVHVFLSADQMKTDISGLKLINQRPTIPPEVRDALLEWLRPESLGLNLWGRFLTLGIRDQDSLEHLVKGEIIGLLGQLRPKNVAKEQPIGKMSDLLRQIQSNLHVDEG